MKPQDYTRRASLAHEIFNKITKYRFWISGGIIFVLGICFLGMMLRTIGVVRSEPHETSLLHQAKQYYLDGAYKKASNLYEKILILEPDSVAATLDLAIIYDDYLSRKDRAIELYKRYIELEPETGKKELVEQWVVQAAQESLGMQELGNETYQNKLSKLQKELDELNKERVGLEEEVEKLSGELYKIQAEHQREIQALQKKRDRVAGQVTAARIRISDLIKALRSAEEARRELQSELEEAVESQRRFRKTKRSQKK